MHTNFFMAVTFATYLTPSWDQVRELTIIAVAEDAFDLLVEASGLVAGKGKAQRPVAYSLERAVLTREISDFQAIRPDHSLLGAIQRTSFRFRQSSATGELALNYNDGTVRRTVHYVYSSFKRGVLEPSESFLRVSSRHERLLQNTGDNSPYFISEDLQISAWNIVLVTGGGPSTGARTSSTCAYVLGESVEAPVTAGLAVAIKKTLENHDVYHTTRDNGSANFWAGSKAERAPWNIKGVYGFCRNYELFVAWLDHMGCETPERLGAPRDAAGSGRYVLTKEYHPWRDPRLLREGRETETFALYKMLVSELLYWRIVARERNEKGTACCRSCATTDYQTYDGKSCLACFEEIDDPRFPKWVLGTLMRKERIRWIQEVQDGRSAEDISSAPDWWYTTVFFELDSTDHPQWYKDLNEYPDLDEEFRDLRELLEQGRKYDDFCWERKRGAAVAELGTTRKRSASHMDTSESD
jgi:hypothetical protein